MAHRLGRLVPFRSLTFSATRTYAISLKPVNKITGKKGPRVFKDKKAFQYNWYTRILQSSSTSPLLIFHHNDFTANRLNKLRADIHTAFQKVQSSLSAPLPTSESPTFTVVRTSIFGVALRNLSGINLMQVEKMINNQAGSIAVLSFPTLHPPHLNAVLRILDRTVPTKAPKTEAEIAEALAEKNADPDQPGRRMKRQRQIRIPELKLLGALIENRVLLADGVQNMSKLPSLGTLHAQLVALLNAPGAQLAMVLGEAGGGKLARTLDGLKRGLEESQ